MRRPLRRGAVPAGVWFATGTAGVVVLSVIPLVRLGTHLFAGGAGGLARAGAVATWLATSRQVQAAFLHSLFTTSASAVVTTALALVLAVAATKTDLPGRRWVAPALLVPLVVPPHLLTIAYIHWAGPAGALQQALRWISGAQGPLWSLYGPGGIVALLVLVTLPLAFFPIRAGLLAVPREVEEAARCEGASGWRLLLHVTLPMVRPYLAAAALLAALSALSDFGVPALLGIPSGYITLPTLIYREVASALGRGFDRPVGLALALALPAGLLVGLQTKWAQGAGGWGTGEQSGKAPFSWGRGRWAGAVLLVGGLAALVLVPFMAMAAMAMIRAYGLPLRWAHLTLEHFAFVLGRLEPLRRALLHSLWLAGSAALVTAGLAGILGYGVVRAERQGSTWRRWWWRPVRLAIALPGAVPGMVFSLGVLLAWLRPPLPGLELYGTLGLLNVAYFGRFLAFAFEPVAAGWRDLDPSLEEAAQVDGASFLQAVRHVLAPILRPALAAGAVLVLTQSFAELTLSAILAGSGTETVGWLIFGLEQGGYASQSAALGTLLALGLVAAGSGRLAARRLGGAWARLRPWASSHLSRARRAEEAGSFWEAA
ncbi:iron ABC transporter permease [Carboxydochorda subterranea]|uniref:Iron ABC transporter permease n=1 Tax=Carboxydichorda subterranea TaxID=3109565 RepID=A0ABZ1BXC9_9FIRM|nr:iron ABC transporter permease [Limnochorda sp. L945t]WRP17454.1 iron ABC transporter permease [Limnochorda sp. L945t]